MGYNMIYFRKYGLMILAVLFLLASCATKAPEPSSRTGVQKPYKVFGKWYYPIPDASGYREKGIASWYGSKFHGKTTANGEKYNMHAMTAAHKTLPFGTLVEVRCTETGKKVQVRINDRGPFVRGRIIDLSYAAAKAIGLDKKGVGPVDVRALASENRRPVDLKKGNFAVQLGAFTEKNNADRLALNLKKEGYRTRILSHRQDGTFFYRVRVTGYTDLSEAKNAENHFRNKGYEGAMTVAE
ncbi:septal ring lytic transglycosylase RlpA family protein [Desulfobotulus mexicanus]|uniref:Probable endolytic peptidoglycan transglycosylase RlpA n=2 Tax=Desulfobotulus mexicanus TaxID=2586642 RepID=A0A5S5MEH0_9BACT|nr:septal ring lytic transglycosylase RlpA family protein [Desulfobotulus mexicanus]